MKLRLLSGDPTFALDDDNRWYFKPWDDRWFACSEWRPGARLKDGTPTLVGRYSTEIAVPESAALSLIPAKKQEAEHGS